MSAGAAGEPRPSSAPVLWRAWLWVGAVALLVRAAYLVEHLGSAFFGVPILDEAFYDAAARALLAGEDLAALNPGFRPLLYPLFLALAYRVGGDSDVVAAVALQHAMGVATALLVAAMARRVFRSDAAALAGGLLYALAGPPLFFEGELLIEALFALLVALALWAALDAEERGGAARWLLAGGLVAIASLARPNALVVLPAFALALMLPSREPAAAGSTGAARGSRWRGAALALAGALATLLVAGLALAPLAGRFQLVGGAGGVNLYLGNKRGADGAIPRQDRPVHYGHEYRDTVQLFADEEYRRARAARGEPVPERPDPGAVSRYWLGRTSAEVAADPGAWLRLMARKVSLLLWNREIPNNKSWDFVAREEGRLLRRLPVRWWLLLALAPLGLAAAWRAGGPSRAGAFWVAAYAALLGAGVVLFFVNDRYRIPLWAPMAVLAGGGLVDLARAARRGPRPLARRAGVALALAAVSLADRPWLRLPGPARDHLFRSIAAREKGRGELALADARTAVALEPRNATAWFQLGLVEQDHGRDAAALAAYRQAVRRDPGEARIHNNAGTALERLGRSGDAAAAYRAALARDPDYGPALVNLALLEIRARRWAAAAGRLERASAAGYTSPSAEVAAALVARAAGREEEARRQLAAVRAREPRAVDALLAELARPLDPTLLDGG